MSKRAVIQPHAMRSFAQVLSRHQHAAAVLLYTVAVVITSVWVDYTTQGFTDIFRDVLATAFVVLFGILAADLGLSLEGWARRRWQVQLRTWQEFAFGLPFGALVVLMGHALLPLGALVVQVPRVGLALLPTIGIAAEFVTQKAWMPALITGAVSAALHRSMHLWLSHALRTGSGSVAEPPQSQRHSGEHSADPG